jgi:hypothetical protein
MPLPHPGKVLAAAIAAACAAAAPCLGAGEPAELVTVVASKAADGYTRSKGPDGGYRPEFYAFANGGHWTGTVRDSSVDNVPFMDVARTIAAPLAGQGFLPARDAKDTRLLIVLYWGRTRTPEHAQDSFAVRGLQDAQNPVKAAKATMDHQFYNDSAGLAPASAGNNYPCVHYSAADAVDAASADNAMAGALALSAAAERTRDQTDAANAALLGYDEWLSATGSYAGTALEHRRQDMLEELEQDRYFVVLMAYDFQKMWKEKKHVLLWETRFSVRQRGVEFDKQLEAMARNAQAYFGQDTHGLVRKDMPLGHVEIGEVKSLGAVAQK